VPTDAAAAPTDAASAPAAPVDAAAAPADPAATPVDPTAAGAPAETTGGPLETIPVPEQAATPETTPPPADEPFQIEEVIVTAQRREERLQDVPISITVFNQEQISKANITNSSDLATYTPSLQINSRFGSENASFAIRGFTQDLRTTASVATYFAEVVAPRGQTSQNSGDGAGPGALFDLENVQVLKGPQGTLFGRNTTGGAVLIVPKKPSREFEGYIEASGGNWTARRVQAIVNIPVFDSLRFRAGMDYNKRDGVMNNITKIGAEDLGDTNYKAFRLSGVWDITDNLENYTIVSYTDSDTNGQTSRLFECNTAIQPDNPFGLLLAPLTGPGCNAQLQRQEASGQNGYYDLVSTIKTPITAIEEKRAINTTTWQVTDDLTIKNILAYAHLKTLNGSAIFGTQFTETAAGLSTSLTGLLQRIGLPGFPLTLPDLPVSLPAADPRREFLVGISVLNPDEPVTSQKTWVEEVQIQGSSFDGFMKWQTGAYYEHSMPDGFSGNNSGSFLSCEVATLEGPPEGYNCFDIANGNLGGVLVQEYKTDYINRAVYAQSTFAFTQALSATLGLRYTMDDVRGYGIKTLYKFTGSVQQPPSVGIATPEVQSKAPTGLLEVDFKPNDRIMMYGKFLRGYRQGSVNLAADPGIDTFKPEKVNTYEVGLKTSFQGFVSGRFNVAAFHNQFTDMQLQFGYISPTSGPTTMVINAGKARISGAEVESFLQAGRFVSLNLSYSYLKTKLLEQEDFSDEVTAAAGQTAGFSVTPIADVGDTLPFAPAHTVVAALNFRLPLPPEWGYIDLGPTYVYTSDRRTSATSTSPNDELPAFSLLNANFSWMQIFGVPLDFSLFGTNLLDEEYSTYYSGTYNVLGFDSRMVGLPRMIGGRLRYNFGALGG
jgi:iron complex outermembrane receptor protein